MWRIASKKSPTAEVLPRRMLGHALTALLDRGHCHAVLKHNVLNPTHRGIENRKMYAIKQIKVCAEYWGKVPKASVGFSGTYTHISGTLHYDGNALSLNPGLQYPHLHGPVHTPDYNRWDTPPV